VENFPDDASFHDGRLTGGFDKASKPGSGGGPLPILYSQDLEATRARSFPGGRRFHFADPTGNDLAVWSE
jgi:uncharacterized protein